MYLAFYMYAVLIAHTLLDHPADDDRTWNVEQGRS